MSSLWPQVDGRCSACNGTAVLLDNGDPNNWYHREKACEFRNNPQKFNNVAQFVKTGA